MNKSDKIYVAGHRGLVGTALLKSLREQGFENLITRTHEELDLTNESLVAEFFRSEKPEYVFLAAAKVGGIYANNTYPADFIRDNIAIQTNVIHHAYLNNTKRLLFLGSSCIYPKKAPQPLKEEYLLTGQLEETNRPYALAKISGIEMCWSYNRQYGTQFLSVMPTNLFGAGDNYDLNNSHVIPALVRKFHLAKLALQGNSKAIEADEYVHGKIPEQLRSILLESCASRKPTEVTIWGSGTPRREFMSSQDMSEVCIFLMGLSDEYFQVLLGQNRNDGVAPIVNIGTGEDISIKELAETIGSVVGYKGKLEFDKDKPDGTPQKLLSIERLKKLGWKGESSFISRLEEAYEDYLKTT